MSERKRTFFDLIVAGGVLVTAFAAGRAMPIDSVSQTDWKIAAGKNGWIPQEQCPAFPVTVRVTSPGNGATLEQSYGTIYSRFVVELSRPIAEKHEIYLVAQRENQSNHVLVERLTNGVSEAVQLPFDVTGSERITFWAIVLSGELSTVANGRTGEVYTSVDQLRLIGQFLALSDPVRVTLTQHD